MLGVLSLHNDSRIRINNACLPTCTKSLELSVNVLTKENNVPDCCPQYPTMHQTAGRPAGQQGPGKKRLMGCLAF